MSRYGTERCSARGEENTHHLVLREDMLAEVFRVVSHTFVLERKAKIESESQAAKSQRTSFEDRILECYAKLRIASTTGATIHRELKAVMISRLFHFTRLTTGRFYAKPLRLNSALVAVI